MVRTRGALTGPKLAETFVSVFTHFISVDRRLCNDVAASMGSLHNVQCRLEWKILGHSSTFVCPDLVTFLAALRKRNPSRFILWSS